jgi:hypothetical protein
MISNVKSPLLPWWVTLIKQVLRHFIFDCSTSFTGNNEKYQSAFKNSNYSLTSNAVMSNLKKQSTNMDIDYQHNRLNK